MRDPPLWLVCLALALSQILPLLTFAGCIPVVDPDNSHFFKMHLLAFMCWQRVTSVTGKEGYRGTKSNL